MKLIMAGVVAGAVTLTIGTARADASRWHHSQKSFHRVATLPNYRNRSNAADTTVSEIVAATADGRTLVYTDAEAEAIGFVGIDNPRAPVPLGTLDVGGEPTSVDVLGNRYALVAVNTSPSYVAPSGHLAVVDIDTRMIVTELDLGGQPDSLKISPDGRYAAVAIENERDEDIIVDGVEGGLPQLPAGYLAIVDIDGAPATWGVRTVDVTGLADYGADDPEPEFVDVNADNLVAMSMQENNHIVVVDLASGDIVDDFPAGTVDLDRIDTVEEDVISLTGSLTDVPREPDAVAWVPGPGGELNRIATANEGDLFGGSRGFSIFATDGSLEFDSGNTLEHIAVRHGHYPEGRSENKGSEPEGAEYGRFEGTDYLFIGSERGSYIAVYALDRNGQPEFRQLLPGPLGPEGVLAIPSRNLFVASGEEDDPTYGVRSSLMIYQLGRGGPDYPQLVSANDADGLPIPWSAMSGMTSVPGTDAELLAVWDSFYAESRIFTIDASQTPAVVAGAVTIRGGTGDYDPEGITIAPDGTYWVASEGNASGSRPNRLLQTDTSGAVIREVGLPAEIEACRAASTNTATLGSGFEGVAAVGRVGSYRLLVAQQRGWDYTTPECEALDDDAGGLNANGQPNRTRIWVYDPQTDAWNHFGWELAPVPENASWVGLSEVTVAPGGWLVVIERDNRTGDWAELKTLAWFRPFAAFDGLVDASEKYVRDLIPALEATHGLISDKPEGVAITRRGQVFVVTDNDGVDDWSGETWFLRLRPDRPGLHDVRHRNH